MSDNIDFKALWNKGNTSAPDIEEIFTKSARLSRRVRLGLWFQNIALSATLMVFFGVWWFDHPQQITTKIGICLMITAIVAYLTASNQQFWLLPDGDLQADSREYLARMIRLKQKQVFLSTSMLTAYLILLSVGLGLYFIEYLGRASILVQVLAYTITFAWMAFAWFYLAPKGIKKQRKAINDIIAKLEEVNGQLE